ncbi:hypothetical protein GMORB2_6065 [Geosmithia morbida]|uniref:Uncharacterized protein n=1 Tax=Geosmithia morbida TaxID=1094350 RepID=A0A9P5D6C4_9HYPO|nr:uncharacterized protein GMORB2_6065 [Geosmithia morbida]KAF4123364.1 hypothetical protein GMORB2_6065 [Geosmithia morbida]
MGNICGKTESDNFSSPGRIVGSAPPAGPKSAPVPKKAVVGGPGRTLGADRGSSSAESPDQARQRAAEAAEARAAASNKSGGKLQSQLSAQKRQNRNDTLKEASRNEIQAREAEEAANVRNYN